ncbi:MAG: tetratricopeptide repeat protein [Coriobacteriia bacterium]
MAINKQSSPMWVKGVIIFVAITFIASVAGVAVIGAGGGGASDPGSTGTASGATGIAAKYQPTLDALNASLQADPTNAGLLTQLGHTYYEYAAELTNAGLGTAATPLWGTAISFYDRVLAVEPTNAVVLGNKAFAAYYSNSPVARDALTAFIATNDAALAEQISNAKGYLSELESLPTTGSAPTTTP